MNSLWVLLYALQRLGTCYGETAENASPISVTFVCMRACMHTISNDLPMGPRYTRAPQHPMGCSNCPQVRSAAKPPARALHSLKVVRRVSRNSYTCQPALISCDLSCSRKHPILKCQLEGPHSPHLKPLTPQFLCVYRFVSGAPRFFTNCLAGRDSVPRLHFRDLPLIHDLNLS